MSEETKKIEKQDMWFSMFMIGLGVFCFGLIVGSLIVRNTDFKGADRILYTSDSNWVQIDVDNIRRSYQRNNSQTYIWSGKDWVIAGQEIK